MKRLAKKIIPSRLRVALRAAFRPVAERLFDSNAVACYSQEGEDVVLSRLFERRQGTGFYVDVGAHHPRRFSNTFVFYKRGWRGINVDATPGLMERFRRERPRDVNVECAISRDGRELTFRMYDEPALNTLAGRDVSGAAAMGFKVVAERRLPTRTLADVLREHLPVGQMIDFMSVDVEGMDLEALEGNDWSAFRPEYVLVECLGTALMDVPASPVGSFLRAHGYEVVGKCVHTVFFRRSA